MHIYTAALCSYYFSQSEQKQEKSTTMVRVDTRREVLRLYREILRTSRKFHWPNEQGELWCVCEPINPSVLLMHSLARMQTGPRC